MADMLAATVVGLALVVIKTVSAVAMEKKSPEAITREPVPDARYTDLVAETAVSQARCRLEWFDTFRFYRRHPLVVFTVEVARDVIFYDVSRITRVVGNEDVTTLPLIVEVAWVGGTVLYFRWCLITISETRMVALPEV